MKENVISKENVFESQSDWDIDKIHWIEKIKGNNSISFHFKDF